MNSNFSNSVLIVVYIGVLVIGLILIGGAIISLLRSFTPGRQTQPKRPPSPLFSRAGGYSVGLGAAVFGAAGLLALLLFRVDPGNSVLWALGVGLVAGFVAMALLVYLPTRGQAMEALIDFDATGRRATVVIAIPANGLGEVAFRDGREQVNLGARSADGRAIAEGAIVIIQRVTNRIAVVANEGQTASDGPTASDGQ